MELENLNNNHTMSSREIAQLTGKNHQHVLRDCDKLNLSYEKLGMSKIGQGYFTTPHTGNFAIKTDSKIYLMGIEKMGKPQHLPEDEEKELIKVISQNIIFDVQYAE